MYFQINGDAYKAPCLRTFKIHDTILAFAIFIEILARISSANIMAAAYSSNISSEDRDPEDELRDRFDLGFGSNGALLQYDRELNGITERTFQFDVHNGDKKKNQECRNS